MSNESSTSSTRINVTLPVDLYDKLKAIAEAKGTGPTTLAGRVLINWLDGYEEREAIKTVLKSLGDGDD